MGVWGKMLDNEQVARGIWLERRCGGVLQITFSVAISAVHFLQHWYDVNKQCIAHQREGTLVGGGRSTPSSARANLRRKKEK